MTSTGYNVMGWQVDPTTGDIRKDTVSALRVMSEKYDIRTGSNGERQM